MGISFPPNHTTQVQTLVPRVARGGVDRAWMCRPGCPHSPCEEGCSWWWEKKGGRLQLEPEACRPPIHTHPGATVLQCTTPRSPTTKFQLKLQPGLSVLNEGILLKVRGLNVFYLKFVSLTHKFLDLVRGPSFGLLPRACKC